MLNYLKELLLVYESKINVLIKQIIRYYRKHENVDLSTCINNRCWTNKKCWYVRSKLNLNNVQKINVRHTNRNVCS
jgi:hypothetical protein